MMQFRKYGRVASLAWLTLAGVDDKTVASVRDEAERRAEIPHVATATDTAGRVQPTRRPAVKPRHAAAVADHTEPEIDRPANVTKPTASLGWRP